MPEVNYLAVAAGGSVGLPARRPLVFAVLFAKQVDGADRPERGELKAGNMAMIFGGAFVLNLIAAYVLAMFLGPMPLKFATLAGLSVGLCWVATSLGVNYLFERRPLGLWLINAGYFIAAIHDHGRDHRGV